MLQEPEASLYLRAKRAFRVLYYLEGVYSYVMQASAVGPDCHVPLGEWDREKRRIHKCRKISESKYIVQ